MRAVLDGLKRLGMQHAVIACFLEPGPFTHELMDICPGTKTSPFATANNHAAQIKIIRQFVNNRRQRAPHRFGQGIFAFRLTDRDGGNAIINGDIQSGLISHGISFWGLLFGHSLNRHNDTE